MERFAGQKRHAKLMNKLQFTIEDADLEALLQKDAVESGTP